MIGAESADTAPEPEVSPAGPGEPQVLEPVEETGVEVTVSALVNPDSPDLPDPLVDTSRLISGKLPPDGIPPVDDPLFEKAAWVDWLSDQEPVIGLEINGDARAYPVQILIWHEIVNDKVGGTPVTVTYCPLCNSAIVFDRRLGCRLSSTSAPRASCASPISSCTTGRPSPGGRRSRAGRSPGSSPATELERFPVTTVAVGPVARCPPRTGGCSAAETGFERDYGRNPYPSYDAARCRALPVRWEVRPKAASEGARGRHRRG